MEFRIATEKDTAAVKGLWDYCFETEYTPFFKYYFEKAYEPEHTLVGYEGDLLAGMVHLRQYNLNIRGAVRPVSYMVGVATDPVARRGGIGGRLLKSSLEELKERKQGITILMPSKAAFYQQYGWDLYAHQWVQTLPLEELRALTDKTMEFGLIKEASEWPLLAPVYEQYTKNLTGYAVRGEKEWTRLLESLFAEGVRVAYVRGPVTDEDGTAAPHGAQGKALPPIEGYAMYRLGAEEIPVTEFVYTTRRAQRGLLNFFYNHRSQGSSIRWNEGMSDESYIFHPDGKSGHTTMPYMMSRIVDVPLAISQVPASTDGAKEFLSKGLAAFAVRVTDPLVDWNDDVFVLTITKDYKVQASRVEDTTALTSPIPTISVGALSLILMGRMTASELVFEGKLDIPAGCEIFVEALDKLYPKQKTFINEWW